MSENNFDWETYINNYEDLQNAGINTQELALQHWNNHGKNEGRTDKNIFLNIDVFIVSGGKCGSSTLNNTMNKNNFISIHSHGSEYFYITYNKNIFNLIDNCSKEKTVYIIDSYRTPIERKISSFFHNIKLHCPKYTNIKIDELINLFNDKFLYELEEYHSINEILKYYNIPVFDKFDFDNKYNIIEKDNIIFIKIRFNDINDWNKILSNIFNKDIIIYPDNLTENKDIYTLYNKFKSLYKVPKTYVDHIKNNDKEFMIYNSDIEKHKYIEYWSENSY